MSIGQKKWIVMATHGRCAGCVLSKNLLETTGKVVLINITIQSFKSDINESVEMGLSKKNSCLVCFITRSYHHLVKYEQAMRDAFGIAKLKTQPGCSIRMRQQRCQVKLTGFVRV